MAYLYIFGKSPKAKVYVYRIVDTQPMRGEDDQIRVKYCTSKDYHQRASIHLTVAAAEEGVVFDRKGMPVMWLEERNDTYAVTELRKWRLELIERREEVYRRWLKNYAEEKSHLLTDDVDSLILDRVVEEV